MFLLKCILIPMNAYHKESKSVNVCLTAPHSKGSFSCKVLQCVAGLQFKNNFFAIFNFWSLMS